MPGLLIRLVLCCMTQLDLARGYFDNNIIISEHLLHINKQYLCVARSGELAPYMAQLSKHGHAPRLSNLKLDDMRAVSNISGMKDN